MATPKKTSAPKKSSSPKSSPSAARTAAKRPSRKAINDAAQGYDTPSSSGKRLVIVESPSKAKTINKYLGSDFTVVASVGHIKELPKKEIGIDFDNHYEPRYETIAGKEKIVSQLRKLAKESREIMIATDPDREGEAIAWHIANEVESSHKPISRVLFNEITQKAVREAIGNPKQIDYQLVRSQQARQAMDKIVGYRISPFLWDTVLRGLSAGRVQSVALRLVCEREEEISKFQTKEYWSIVAEFTTESGEKFFAKLIRIDGKEFELPNEESARAAAEEIKAKYFAISEIKRRRVKRNPPAPFTTSLLQQASSNQLGYGAKNTMRIAQQLYEGIELGADGTTGLITYMRTDSKRISKDAQAEVRGFIEKMYGKAFVPESAAQFKTAENAQDAHEAIRPTSVDRTPKSVERFLSRDQFRLYELIWKRLVASQMSQAELEQTSVDVLDSGSKFMFRATGSVVLFEGFLKVYGDDVQLEYEAKQSTKDNEGDDEDKPSRLPKNLVEKEPLTLGSVKENQHFTKPPARYSEASLVKELDGKGIGRPSTYATIMSTIVDRGYVELKGKQMVATELGMDVSKILVANFPDLFNVEFTANMETELDKIAAGEDDYEKVLDGFYLPLEKSLGERKKNPILPQNDNAELCDKCGIGQMIVKRTKSGKFLGCSNYPKCQNIKPMPNAVPKQAPLESGVHCYKCETGRMLVRKGRFGTFLACSNYPDCDGILNLDKEGRITPPKTPPLETDIECPRCKANLYLRSGKRGLWLGCSRFPKCRGRKAWSELEESDEAKWTQLLALHEAQYPPVTLKLLDESPLDLSLPVSELIENTPQPEVKLETVEALPVPVSSGDADDAPF
ncbi:MAG: type I DNA topoisomerase [Rhizobacter sp.]|nr:type I DNA topoisomerase [Chlorobiales bacterium]